MELLLFSYASYEDCWERALQTFFFMNCKQFFFSNLKIFTQQNEKLNKKSNSF